MHSWGLATLEAISCFYFLANFRCISYRKPKTSSVRSFFFLQCFKVSYKEYFEKGLLGNKSKKRLSMWPGPNLQM